MRRPALPRQNAYAGVLVREQIGNLAQLGQLRLGQSVASLGEFGRVFFCVFGERAEYGGDFQLGLDRWGGDPIAGDAIALQNPLRGGLSFPSVENQTAG